VVAGVTIVTQLISALVLALLITLALSTAELVASIGSNGLKALVGKEKEAKTYFWSIEKYTSFLCFLEMLPNIWSVLLRS
jgi:hypothetical protein